MDKNDLLYKEILKSINFNKKEIEFVHEKEYLIWPLEINESLSNIKEMEDGKKLFDDVEVLNEMVLDLESVIIDSIIEKVKRFCSLNKALNLSAGETNFEKIITPFTFSSEHYKRLLYAFDDLNYSDIINLSYKLDIKQKHALYLFDQTINFENRIPKIMLAVKKELSKNSLEELNILLSENKIMPFFIKIKESFYNNPVTKEAIVNFEKELLKEMLIENNNIKSDTMKKRL